MYVDAFYNRDKDIVNVVERHTNGKRAFKQYPCKYVFYYPDAKGKFTSIYGQPLSRVVCKTQKELRKETSLVPKFKLHESDINQTVVCLSENYLHAPAPALNVAFWDIEVDFSPERGYASPEDSFMPITAISVYLQWLETLVCLAIPPKTLTKEQAEELVKDIPNTIIFSTEAEMLKVFLDLIEDADVISGWNSEGFDLPYTVNRVTKVLSKDDTRRFCLWDQLPKKREYEKFGRTAITYDLVGRIHLDSLEVYRKYTYEERHSYRLDVIGETEVGEKKVAYEGTLDQLYNQDFRKFIEYNRQDTALLDKLDRKLKFIDLANTIAHENTVLIQTTMGAVAVTEQAIINEAHRRNFIIPDRKRMSSDEDTQAAGAYVAYPKKGLHDWIGSLDVNSLYPSVLRSLNMSPETIVGQLRPARTEAFIKEMMDSGKSFAAAWEGMFGSLEYESVMQQEIGAMIHIDWEDGTSDVLSAAQVYQLIFESRNPYMLSANGTIFTLEKEGIIPGLLSRWYAERKVLQKELKLAIELNSKVTVSESLINKIKNESTIECATTPSVIFDCIENEKASELNYLINNNILTLDDNKLGYAEKKFAKQQLEYWDKLQTVKKLNLNALYGSLLNSGCRFFDKRLGQSTTLTGRQVVKHMSEKVNEFITGVADYRGKSVIYNDTDSIYFTAYPMLKEEIDAGKIQWNKETVIQLYDQIGDEVNKTFPEFMRVAFHCPEERCVIKAGREIVALKGLFITKKRYAVLYFDKDGKRVDTPESPGKIKAMGLDLKRSDTPEFMQEFLSAILKTVLLGGEEPVILEMIKEFRIQFKTRPGWEKGSPKRVNNITEYRKKEELAGKANLPGHVRAALNWNTLRRMNSDKYSMQIIDGAKVIVCKLRDNPMGYTSVAYPIDELRLPQWFKDLPFDHDEMENTIIDNKLDNLIGVLHYDLQSTLQSTTFNDLFSF